MLTVMHLCVLDPKGQIVTVPNPTPIAGLGIPLVAQGGRWRVACGLPLKSMGERIGNVYHICVPDAKAIMTEKVSHCPKCQSTPEYRDALIAEGFGRPEGDLEAAGPSDAA
jgi:hypothetical protein